MACRADRSVRRDRRLAGLDVGNAQVAQRVGGDAVRGAGKGQAQVGDLQPLACGLHGDVVPGRGDIAAVQSVQGQGDALRFPGLSSPQSTSSLGW